MVELMDPSDEGPGLGPAIRHTRLFAFCILSLLSSSFCFVLRATLPDLSYLQKPLTVETLTRKVRDVLDAHPAAEPLGTPS